MSNDTIQKEARRLTNLISNDSKLGLIAYTAKTAIKNAKQYDFIKETYDQLTIHDPVSTKRKLGNELSTQIINFIEG